MKENLDNLFPDTVGQLEAKQRLGFYLDSYHKTRLMPTLLFSGQKGIGKSHFCVEVGKNLVEYDEKGNVVYKEDGVTPKKKKWICINASSIKNFRWLMNSVLLPFVCGKPSSLMIDEASELKSEVAFNLLSLLNPNVHNRNTLVVDDYPIDIDFKLNTFLFCTTNPEKVLDSLKDRCERIDLTAYSLSDLATIIQKATPDVTYIEDVIEDIASTVRQNARKAIQVSGEIKTYLNGGGKFGRSQWNDLKQILSIHPLGLRRTEIDILRILQNRGEGCSLNALVSKTGLSRTAIQLDYEMILLQFSLMEISGVRKITGKGMEYLKNLEAIPT